LILVFSAKRLYTRLVLIDFHQAENLNAQPKGSPMARSGS
jgi:hypothetical protein